MNASAVIPLIYSGNICDAEKCFTTSQCKLRTLTDFVVLQMIIDLAGAPKSTLQRVAD